MHSRGILTAWKQFFFKKTVFYTFPIMSWKNSNFVSCCFSLFFVPSFDADSAFEFLVIKFYLVYSPIDPSSNLSHHFLSRRSIICYNQISHVVKNLLSSFCELVSNKVCSNYVSPVVFLSDFSRDQVLSQPFDLSSSKTG